MFKTRNVIWKSTSLINSVYYKNFDFLQFYFAYFVYNIVFKYRKQILVWKIIKYYRTIIKLLARTFYALNILICFL